MTDGIHPLAGVIAGLARLITGVQVRWVDCEPTTQQRLYIANHTSHLDAVVLWSSLPEAVRALTRPIAAKDYWTESTLRRFLAERVFRALLIERNPLAAQDGFASARTMIDRLMEALGDTYSAIVFPEGTRGTGEEVASFKSGIYHMAQRKPEIELVPACIENLNRILPKGEVLPIPLLSFVSFGPPFRLQPDESRKAFLERARAAVCGLRRRGSEEMKEKRT
jgi:1-acyl-sn-glycerol-3-phosphate acyltransferase